MGVIFGISGEGRRANWGINMFNVGEGNISRNYSSGYEIKLLDKKEICVALRIPIL